MSLRSRIDRLERILGEPAAPKLVVITTASDRYEINRLNRDYLALSVPWSERYVHGGGDNPIDALTDEQRALIGPNDKVVSLCLPPNDRDDDRGIDGL